MLCYNNFSIRQGDAYPLKFQLKSENDLITPEAVDDVEITLGETSKKYSVSEIIYNETDKSWSYPLTQAETFALTANEYPAEVRIKFIDGEVVGQSIPFIYVQESLSEDIL